MPTVENWIRKGAPVVSRGGRGVSWEFDLLAMAEWHFLGQRAGDGAINPDALPPQDRRAWYDSEMKRRELQERDRELIPRAEVEEAVATAFAAITQEILAIPDLLERSHGIEATVAAQVERGLCSALDNLVEKLSKLAPIEAPESEVAA